MTVTRIGVGGTSTPYDVVVGNGILGELPALVGERAQRVAVIHPDTLEEKARPVCEILRTAGYDVFPLPVPDGEAAKDASVAADPWARLGQAACSRTAVLAGVAGGAPPDPAGLVPAP